MTKSKDEILDSEHWKFVYDKGISSVHTKTFPEAYRQQAKIAMDLWGKQCVYLFGQFMLKNDIAYDQFKNPEWGLMSRAQKEERFFKEFLPSLFISEDKTKQP